MQSRWQQSLRAVQLGMSKFAVFFASFGILRLPNILLTLSDILFFSAACLLFSTIRVPRDPFGPATNAFLLFLGLLITGFLVSSVFASVPERALVYIVQFAFAYGVLAYVITAESYETIVSLVKWYLAGLFIGLVIALYWFWTEPTPNIFVSGAGRLMGMSGGPNGQSALIGLSMPLLLYLWMKERWPVFVLVPVLLTMLYSLLATSSNSGLIAAFAAFFFFFILVLTLKRFVRVAGALAVAAPLFIYYGLDYLPQTFHDRVLSAVTSGNIEQAGTFSIRVDLITEGLDILDDTIFLGIGADQFRVFSVYNLPVHNAYILLWTEGGMISLIAWLGMIMTIVVLGLSAWRNKDSRLEGVTAATTAITLLVVAISVTHLYPRAWTAPLILAQALVVTRFRLQALQPVRLAAKAPDTSLAARTRRQSLGYRRRLS